MANFIPKFIFNEFQIFGFIALGSDEITLPTDIGKVRAGMFIDSPALPANTRVLSVGVSTLTLDKDATGNASNEAFLLREEIEFNYPSTKQVEPIIETASQVSESIGGERQVQINNMVEKVEIEFKFLTLAQIDFLRDVFFKPWAGLGKKFKYYESKDESVFSEVQLDRFEFKPIRAFPKAGNFLYNLPLRIRRVIL